jgi:hypothetical protein
VQAPALLQVPFWQLAAVVLQVASGAPVFFFVHPVPLVLQPWQVPQLSEQQIFDVPARLSSHFPLSHSESPLQPEPSAFFVPQTSPALAQVKPPQDVGARGVQFPAPSQVLGVRVEPVQVEPQAVPLAPYWHLPAPSHMPVVPQVVFAAVQVLWPTWPAGTARHCPSLCPFRSFVHAEHPVQSLSQQTPSATTPDVH